MLNSNVDKNVHLNWKHIGITTICSQNNETFSEKQNQIWILYNKDNITIRQVDGIFFYKNKKILLTNNRFICGKIEINLPQRDSISTIERLILSLGLNIPRNNSNSSIDIKNVDFKEILYTLTLLALKDLGIISNSFNEHKQKKYGEVVFEAYLKAVSGKGNIPANNKYIRWLNEQDTLQLKSKLFTTSNYQKGVNSMKYTPTEYAENIFKTLFELLKSIDFKHQDFTLIPLDFIVDINILSELKLRDTMLLLSNCVGFNCGFIIRPEIEDKQYSRLYSVFTSISSDTRKKLGFINYDIGSALQTICLHLVKDVSIYPLHQELVNDKVSFRTKIMDITGNSMEWVKTELSKIDNMDKMPKSYSTYKILEEYFDEAQELRKEIISSVEPILLQRANDFAKVKYKKVWKKGKNKPDFIVVGKKESSLFFFIWTQWERQIREAMMNCFDNPNACHQVHDAVYSKQKIDPKIIEQKVLQETGFKVQIVTS